jgi:tmRNA-binding protein
MMKVVNQKAKWDYELGERLEVGVVLTGAEALPIIKTCTEIS